MGGGGKVNDFVRNHEKDREESRAVLSSSRAADSDSKEVEVEQKRTK